MLSRYSKVVEIGQEINQTLTGPADLFEHLFENVSTILDTHYFFMLALYHQSNDTIDYHVADRGTVIHSQDQPLRGVCAYVIEKRKHILEVPFLPESTFRSRIRGPYGP